MQSSCKLRYNPYTTITLHLPLLRESFSKERKSDFVSSFSNYLDSFYHAPS
nr:MAG TPA: hypothetical protein [Caudoviricetes sp.]